MNPALSYKAVYPISTVSALCGVDSATLRNWELRYGLLRPARDANGRPIYSEADVERVRRIIALLDAGVPVDHAASALAGDSRATRNQARPADAWDTLRLRLKTAISEFDDHALQTIYNDALARYPMRSVLEHAVVPLMRDLGARWRAQSGAVAEEHFFTFFLRNKLGAHFHHRAQSLHGPKLLAACMPGEHHDVGLLLFVLAAWERGYRATVLGPDTPFTDLAFAAKRVRAQAIVLSASLEPGPVLLNKLLPDFISGLNIPVCVGGSLSASHRERLEWAGAIALDTDLERALDRIATLVSRAC